MKEVLNTINDCQKRVSVLVTNINPEVRILHAAGLSTAGLTLVATYECLRSKGLPLPDSPALVGLLPVVSLTKGPDLTADELKMAEQQRATRGLSPQIRATDYARRSSAHQDINKQVKAGKISAKEAQNLKDRWDQEEGF